VLAALLTLTAFGAVAWLLQRALGDGWVGLLAALVVGTVLLVAGTVTAHQTFHLRAFGFRVAPRA
jgi:hypothetical protein